MENECIMCGAEIPEGRQICPICERWAKTLELKKPSLPNTELSFGERDGPNFLINYRRSKPLTRFQIWMFKICFGIEAKNL